MITDTPASASASASTKGLLSFLDTGYTSAHVARTIESALLESGFSPFDEGNLEPGALQVLRRGGTVLALRIGTEPPHRGGVLVAAAHTDSPGLHLKHRSARFADSLVQVPVEVYGAPILATWADRDLTITGMLGTRSGSTRGVAVPPGGADAVIPNLAIHLNRDVNNSLSYNRQDHLQAVFGPIADTDDARSNAPVDPDGTVGGKSEGRLTGSEPAVSHAGSARDQFLAYVASRAGVTLEEILDAELLLVPTEGATVTASGLLLSPRIDNLAGCYSILEAFKTAGSTAHTQVAVFYDHEEIGSTTAYGAAGAVTEQFLRRVVKRLGDTPLEQVLPRTVLVSNDAAHALHPNYRDKHDPGYAPLLGGGPVIKKSAIRRYAGELSVSTWVARHAERSAIPLQYLQNRSDIPAGSTIGPAVTSRLSIEGVDIGIPILGMHSIRETGTVADVEQMVRLMSSLYGGDLYEVLDADPPR